MTTLGDAPLDVLPLSSEKARLAAELAQGLDSHALQWLSGFMAGIARQLPQGLPAGAALALTGQAGQAAPTAQAHSAVSERLTILYGSQGGNAKRVAERLASQVQTAGLAVRLVRADAYRTSELKKERLLYIVICTQSAGESIQPPDDARGFFEFLNSKRAPQLPQLAYGVLGLGDSSYADFCGIGRCVDERLAELGAQRLLPRAEADVDIATVADPWAQEALTHARQQLGAGAGTQAGSAQPAPSPGVEADTGWTRERPFQAEVLLNQRIVGRGSDKDVRHIELSLEGSGLHYQPGDALGVWPVQSPELVQRILQTLGLDGAEPVTHNATTLPLAQWLTQRRELTLLTRPFVAAHAQRGGHAALQALLAPEGAAELSKLLASQQLIDLLRHYPTEWDATALVAALRSLAPRMYSIASSQTLVDEEVHLTLAHLTFEQDGEARWGVSSHYLSDASEGESVPVFIEPNERFRLPQDSSSDIIMVGPGTGIAPFRAFVQQRQADAASGRNWLFFGNPHRHSDFLYQTEWQQALQEGALTRLDLAFSRDQAEKIYVQQRLREQGAELWQWLEGGAYLYVCGDAQHMAADVQQALLDVAEQHGGLSPESAADWLKGLQLQGRYLRDVY